MFLKKGAFVIDWFLKKSFKFKILFTYISGLLFISFIGYGYFAYSQISYFNKEMKNIRNNIYTQNKEMIKTAVNVAENTINIAQYLTIKGIVTEKKAKQIAVYELNSIKYGKSGYVWCVTDNGTLMVDPPREDLVGKNVLNIKDKNGFYFFKYALDMLKIKNSDFIEYYWAYPGIKSNDEFKKITYIKKINAWNWIVGSGIYIKDIEEQINSIQKEKLSELKKDLIISIMPGVISSLIVLLALYIIISKIMHSIERVSDISDRLARGDVDISMKLPKMTSDGPISKLIENTNKYIENTYNFIQFKEKTEICSTEYDILEHIKDFIQNDLSIENFAIYTYSGNTYKEYYKNGDIKCLSIDKCLIISKKDIYETCLDKNRRFTCIPIVSNDEVLAIVQIAFEKDSDVAKKINMIKNYIQSTASSIKIRRLNEKLKKMSLKDQLTGLYNRRFLSDFFTTYKSTIKRHNIQTAIAMADIDDFKLVNDTFGHQTGDEIIKHIAIAAKVIFKRNSDLIIRYGGEEFLIILPDTNEENAYKMFLDFKEMVETLDIQGIKKTISIGWCITPEDTYDLQEAIAFADLALYKAKGLGKNRVVKFDKTILNESFKININDNEGGKNE